jgi:hypothetical protein
MPKYSVGVYNAEVREMVRAGQRHPNLKDSWADTHYFDCDASDRGEAMSKMSRRYPKNLGYIVADVLEYK